MKKILLWIIAAIIVFSIYSCSRENYTLDTSTQSSTTDKVDGEENEISIVKNGYLTEFSEEITIGEALDAFLTLPKWKYFETDKGERIVQCSGECVMAGDTGTAVILFQIEEGDVILTRSLTFNNIEQNRYITSSFFDSAYQNASAQ